MNRHFWLYTATTLAIAAAAVGAVVGVAAPVPAPVPPASNEVPASPPAAAKAPSPSMPAAQGIPGSAGGPATTKTVTAEAKAVAVVPDPENTPLAIKVDDPSLNWGPCPPVFPRGCRVTVLRGDPAKPGADLFVQVPAAYRIPPHTHTSAERMVLVTGELEVQYQGRSAVVLQAGQYAYGPAKVPHAARCRSEVPCTLFVAYDSEVDALPFEGKL
jgi:quercetin dioxygenase-like cupin family protein